MKIHTIDKLIITRDSQDKNAGKLNKPEKLNENKKLRKILGVKFLDYTLRIGGEAGQGLATVGGALAQVFSKIGFHVFTHQDYMSRIRGGHNFYQIRFSDQKISASREMVDILLALDLNTIEIHKKSVRDEGFILYDSEIAKKKFEEPEFIDIPFRKIALDVGKNSVMANTVATGAVLGLLDLGLEALKEYSKKSFQGKRGRSNPEKYSLCRSGI